jgi:hypothetical protein
MSYANLRQVFCNNNNNLSTSRTRGLWLCLRDFATKALADVEQQLRDLILFSANKLYSLLEHAKDTASVIRQQTSIVTTDKPWVRKRRRETSPPEKLTKRDKKRFRADESKAAD